MVVLLFACCLLFVACCLLLVVAVVVDVDACMTRQLTLDEHPFQRNRSRWNIVHRDKNRNVGSDTSKKATGDEDLTRWKCCQDVQLQQLFYCSYYSYGSACYSCFFLFFLFLLLWLWW